MTFWNFAEREKDAVALVDERGVAITYGELDRLADAAAAALRLGGSRRLGVLFFRTTASSVVAYLGCLRAGHVAILLPESMAPELKQSLYDIYRPDWIIGDEDDAAQDEAEPKWTRRDGDSPTLHPDLGLLLSTSGTTGSARLVRLSYAAVDANANAIAAFLGLGLAERAITTLPLHYSYGLSVLNSHLAAGASVSLTTHGVLAREFWDRVRNDRVTSLAGVPYLYQLLHRTGFAAMDLPSLRTLTQAGGRLDDRLTRSFGEIARERGWQMFVMYGQTEATARISYVPPERLADKIGSAGIAIPGGTLSVDPTTSEIIYGGPNVMMGYAMSRDDLADGDVLHGTLRTGELGRIDADGYLYLTGRLSRFVKLSGNRIGLDEVETMLQDELGVPVSVSGRDDRLIAWIETDDAAMVSRAQDLFRRRYVLHHSLYRILPVEQLPLLANGKKDYAAMLDAA